MSELVDQAITAYAVLLNRPVWLDPQRFGAARTVWARLLAVHPTLTITDITDACTREADRARIGDNRNVSNVLPHDVVMHAATLASSRQAAADELIAQADAGHLLIEDAQVYYRLVNAGHRDEADQVLANRLDECRLLLRRCDTDTVHRVMRKLEARARYIQRHVPTIVTGG